VAVEVYLRRGSTTRVEWISDRTVYMGIGAREEVDSRLSNTICMTADSTFMQSLKQGGYSGAEEYEAPYTGISSRSREASR